jgi:hypothetical protein
LLYRLGRRERRRDRERAGRRGRGGERGGEEGGQFSTAPFVVCGAAQVELLGSLAVEG